ncbi:MAG: PQQ-binding-like beta-propeller repeat protein, partial [Planctomycetia bacterium]
ARRAWKNGDTARAGEFLADAARAAPTADDRVEAWRELASLWSTTGRPAQAVGLLQNVLETPETAGVLVATDAGARVPAGLWAVGAIDALIAKHGRSVYADADAVVAKQFAQLTQGTDRPPGEPVDGDKLLALADRFPNAAVRPDILLSAAAALQVDDRAAEVRRVYKLLLRRGDVPPTASGQALVGLVGLYEKQRVWEPARAALNQLAVRHGGEPLPAKWPPTVADPLPPSPDAARPVTLGAWSTQRLQRLESAVRTDAAPPAVGLTKPWGADRRAEQLLTPTGAPPTPTAELVLRTLPDGLAACSPRDGRPRWTTAAATRPQAAVYAASGVVVAVGRTLSCLRYDDGSVAWEYVLPPRDDLRRWMGGPAPGLTAPATPADGGSRDDERADAAAALGIDVVEEAVGKANGSAAGLAGATDVGPVALLSVGDAVVAAAERRLFALDADDGGLLWNATLRLQLDGPPTLVGSTICVTGDGALLGFDAADGRLRFETKSAEGAAGPMVHATGGVVALVADRSTVVGLDPTDGRVLWKYAAGQPALESPHVYADGATLLVVVDGYR